MQHIDLPPDASTLMEATRSIGYTLESAIADIIDNSIAAMATHVWVDYFPMDNAYIAITDDGIGMDTETLTKAMQYGSQNMSDVRDEKDLGRFGLGLKTASLSQCRKLTVVSKQGQSIEARRWDLDYVAFSGYWSLGILSFDEIKNMPQFNRLKNMKSGTLVVWEDLDRIQLGGTILHILNEKMDSVRKHLSLVYHRYLSGENGIIKMAIFMNDRVVEPLNPFYKGTPIMSDEIIKIDEKSIIVRPYLLPHTSKLTKNEIELLGGKDDLRKQQGFYIYRNKRLLVWGTWFRMVKQGELSKLARIQVDIPNSLDELWTLDVKKSVAIPPFVIRKNLSKLIEKVAESSKRTWTFRGKKEFNDNVIHLWDKYDTRDKKGIIFQINKEHPLVKKVLDSYPKGKHDIEVLLRQIENGLPLNTIYIELCNDNKIVNNLNSEKEENILQMVKQILDLEQECDRSQILESLLRTEPFNNYKDAIECAWKKGLLS